MNSISFIPFGDLQITKLQHPSGSSFDCIPKLGSALFQLVLKKQDKAVRIFPEFSDPDSFNKIYRAKFPGALLFPFPNRIKNGEYSFQNKHYKLNNASYMGKHAIHGLVYDQEFESAFEPKSGALITTYKLNENRFSGYPFSFTLRNTFKLSSDSLEIESIITNHSEKPGPVGIGWHPYFDLGKPHEISLKLLPNQLVELDEDQIPTGKLIEFESFSEAESLMDFPFDHCFYMNNSNSLSATELRTTDYGLRIQQLTGKQAYNYMQIYHYQDKNWIAVEPMSCAPNAFNNHMGLSILHPAESVHLSFKIQLD